MSRDIRSFFSVKSSKSATVTSPSTVTTKEQNKPDKKRKNVIFDSSDSEDEAFAKKKTKVTAKSPVKKTEQNNKLVPIDDVSQLLGSKPAKRSSLATQAHVEIKKPKKSSKQKHVPATQEAEVHADYDFEATLEQVDFAELDQLERAALAPTNGYSSEASTPATSAPKTEKLSNSPHKTSHSPHKTTTSNSSNSFHKTSSTPPKTSNSPPKPSKSPPKESKSKYFAESATDKILKDYKVMQGLKKESKPEAKTSISQKHSSKSELKTLSSEKHSSKSELKTPTSEKNSKHNSSRAVDSDSDMIEGTPDPLEKRKQHAEAYRKFLSRGGPANPHSKEIPQGAANCLQGLVFVVTGVLDSLDREEIADLVKKYSGKVTQSVSKNTSYVVAGAEPGPSKIEKAEKLGTPIIDEDGFLDLIRTRQAFSATPSPASTSKAKTPKHESKPEPKTAKTQLKYPKTEPNLLEPKSESKNLKNESKSHKNDSKLPKSESKSPKSETKSPKSVVSTPTLAIKKEKMSEGESSQNTQSPATQPVTPDPGVTSAMWVDKYKPVSMKNIIGQQGDRSCAKKLVIWLQNWGKNNLNNAVKKAKPAPWAKNDDGAAFKAALLSGPPGIGKTTTVQLVCRELGLDVVEFNASDTRSKRLLNEEVKELLSSRTLFASGGGAKEVQRALLMEEVDGMAGNQDRGGIAELIALIKNSKVPVICTCNDRNSAKIRSLVNHCFDLRFSKPRTEQIKAAMMSLCFKEGVKIPPDALNAIIEGTNHDIRQVIHHLSLWSAGQTSMTSELTKREAHKSRKEFKIGPWDVTRKVFSEEEQKGMTLNDKASLFFQDYSLGPLFVQENYLSVTPHMQTSGKAAMRERLRRMADAADSIATGDIVDSALRNNQAWGLLPTQAIFASVVPGSVLKGHMSTQIRFPGWLGKNSRRGKFDRLCSELQMHMRLSISGSKEAVALDYLTPVRNKVMCAILERGQDGIPDALETMQQYHLMREDLDSMTELASWGNGASDPWSRVDSKVKAAFTRAYNKSSIMTPYAVGGGVSGGRRKAGGDDMLEEGDDDDGVMAESEEEEDVTHDAMIKLKKPSAAKPSAAKPSAAKPSAAKPSASKTESKTKAKPSTSGRGRGRGKK